MAESLQTALRHHQEGRLDQAELIYRQILDEAPYQADALHLLGVIAHQRGHHERALEFINRAIAIHPEVSTYHANLAEAYRVTGKLTEAASHCQTALRLQPNSPEAHNNLGLVLHLQGKLEEAVAHLEQALQIQPNFALASNNLGNARREQGKNEEAITAFREAVRLQPDLPQAHSNLGQMLLEQGKADEALAHCREAVKLKPDFPEALSNLGNVLRELNQLEEAKDCYARAISLQPRLAMPHNNMAQALQQEGKLDEAFRWYQQALQIDPRSARIHCNLASLFLVQGKEEEASARYRLALQLQPDYAEAHNGLGHILHEQGDLHGALACYREGLRLKPAAATQADLGQVLEELGDIDQAVACFRETLKLDPNHVGALASLATILRDKLPDAELATLEHHLTGAGLTDGNQAALHLGLAHVLDARGQYAQAAEHIRQGKAFRHADWVRQHQEYMPNEHVGFVDQLIEQYTRAQFERLRGWGSESAVPVFIVGLPRSGTTLTEQILASHPRVYGAGELRFAKDAFESLPRVVGAALAPAACLSRIERASLRQVADRHLERLRQLNAAADRIVDKMPDNYLYLGLLAALFPRARFIHCRRDVRDVALSCWITNFRSIRWACDLEHIADRIRNYQRLMEHWKKVLPVPMLEVEYEDTVADLERVARRLVDGCGLEWDPACLAFHETKRPVRTASVTQVRQPIYTRSVQRWKKYEEALAPLLRSLGILGKTAR